MKLRVLYSLLALSSLSTAFADNRPNILVLLADDHSQYAVGCYGNKDVITPNLDKLASEGVRFVNSYATSSICMASRATIVTGLYEYNHGTNFRKGNMQPSDWAQSYPTLLKKAGYYTGFSGKFGFLIANTKPSEGFYEKQFDVWAGGRGQTKYETAKSPGLEKYASKYPHATRAMGAWAVDNIKAAKQAGKPFCLSLSFKAPHEPYDPDPIDLKLYEGKTFATAPNWGPEHMKYLARQVTASRGATGSLVTKWTTDFQISAAKYYALITGVDTAVGMIREALEKEGLSKNTVIIYTSDNGYSQGNHGMGDKVLPYEEASKVPFIVYDPRPGKQVAGTVHPALVGNVDVAPTVISLAGLPIPPKCDGHNIAPLLVNTENSVREYIPLFNFWSAGSAIAQEMAIVTRQSKYIYWFYGGDGMTPTEEAFNLTTDKYEQNPLNVNSPENSFLNPLRSFYNIELNKLKSTPSAGYKSYGLLFDPNVGWDQKKSIAVKQKEDAKGGPGDE